ncbi:MAG: M23 family peptidase [Zetaproteobacteria bacterium]|nr:MAG: M23 family peptidase [Zetaproteobacteria bacterium]
MRLWVLLSGVAGMLAVILTVGVSGTQSAKASVPHEEWLKPEIPVPVQRIMREPIRSGDTAITALERLGFAPAEAYRIANASKSAYALRDIRAGHFFKRVDQGEETHLYYTIDDQTRLHMFRQGKDWQANKEQRPSVTRRLFAQGRIEESLFEAAARAGLDSRTTMNLVDIFAWDIDFARDMRAGDSFRVLYDERYDEEGNLMGTRILAAEFVNQGHRYRAVLYVKTDGSSAYYTPEGKSMRKAYLRAPLKFTRISSRFTLRRKHPVLGFTRAHRGVDYAAPSGTPVRAVGDGRVVFIGWKGGYGRFIQIQHVNRDHSTAYAHLRRFARGLHRGSKVRQGQVIGYVGMSGLATGPHLHFEFRVRGAAVNPLTLKRTPSKPVPANEMASFRQQTAPWLARLDQPLLDVMAVAWE